ncbi:MAG: hypothetical protein PHQ58_22710 [Rhodoferax sp.]|uniref:hypothetical protein n=1 Tax=Rhodoferax sp. TaxID=50421 RepID=UPI002617B5BC|nr:hypothetical protein [Rhodoferax sp.]MDD2883232.1 hypothetical protein [Rhodoferax sp.]
MTATNLYRALRELLPDAPLQVAAVTAVHTATGDSTITWPGGAQQRVRGTSVPVGSNAFVRDGVIEGAAPDLTVVTIEV